MDQAGCAVVYGMTWSDHQSFPVIKGPDLTFNGHADAFVAKVDASGTLLEFCGYIGGADDEYSREMAMDARGNIYVTGLTGSDETSFPVKLGPDLTFNGGNVDAFVARLNPSGETLDYCGYIGGKDIDHGYGIALDKYGAAYVAGITYSDESSFPVRVGPDLTFNSTKQMWDDAFIAKVAMALATDTGTVPESTGSVVTFALSAGPEHAHREYLMLGTMSGTVPGMQLPGGDVTLPLNWDFFTTLAACQLNKRIFQDFHGSLNAFGNAHARFDTLGPLPPGYTGGVFHFAYALIGPEWDFTSNAVAIEIVP